MDIQLARCDSKKRPPGGPANFRQLIVFSQVSMFFSASSLA